MYPARKELAAVVIDEDLAVTLATEAVSYPSVRCSLREAKFATSNPDVTFSELMRGHDDRNQAILLALDEQPFASIGQLAQLFHLPRTTVHRRLTQSLGFQFRYFRRVPHRLSDAQKSN
jgi:AraC-like DNA-binding protein